jgi:hypothetical protein
MSRLLLALLVALLLSASPAVPDSCLACPAAWEAADDVSAALGLDDGSGAVERTGFAAPSLAFELMAPPALLAPPTCDIAAARDRAPPGPLISVPSA